MHIMDYGDLSNLAVASHRSVPVLGTLKERLSAVFAGQ